MVPVFHYELEREVSNCEIVCECGNWDGRHTHRVGGSLRNMAQSHIQRVVREQAAR